jgi:hypothetical protein
MAIYAPFDSFEMRFEANASYVRYYVDEPDDWFLVHQGVAGSSEDSQQTNALQLGSDESGVLSHQDVSGKHMGALNASDLDQKLIDAERLQLTSNDLAVHTDLSELARSMVMDAFGPIAASIRSRPGDDASKSGDFELYRWRAWLLGPYLALQMLDLVRPVEEELTGITRQLGDFSELAEDIYRANEWVRGHPDGEALLSQTEKWVDLVFSRPPAADQFAQIERYRDAQQVVAYRKYGPKTDDETQMSDRELQNEVRRINETQSNYAALLSRFKIAQGKFAELERKNPDVANELYKIAKSLLVKNFWYLVDRWAVDGSEGRKARLWFMLQDGVFYVAASQLHDIDVLGKSRELLRQFVEGVYPDKNPAGDEPGGSPVPVYAADSSTSWTVVDDRSPALGDQSLTDEVFRGLVSQEQPSAEDGDGYGPVPRERSVAEWRRQFQFALAALDGGLSVEMIDQLYEPAYSLIVKYFVPVYDKEDDDWIGAGAVLMWRRHENKARLDALAKAMADDFGRRILQSEQPRTWRTLSDSRRIGDLVNQFAANRTDQFRMELADRFRIMLADVLGDRSAMANAQLPHRDYYNQVYYALRPADMLVDDRPRPSLGRLATDIAAERILDRLLVVEESDDAKGFMRRMPDGSLWQDVPLTRDDRNGVIDAVFQRYHTDIEAARNTEARLTAIARAVRTLQVVRPLGMIDTEANVYLLLPHLLLRNGFEPVVRDEGLFDGEHTLRMIVRHLEYWQSLDDSDGAADDESDTSDATDSSWTGSGSGGASRSSRAGDVSDFYGPSRQRSLRGTWQSGRNSGSRQGGSIEPAPSDPGGAADGGQEPGSVSAAPEPAGSGSGSLGDRSVHVEPVGFGETSVAGDLEERSAPHSGSPEASSAVVDDEPVFDKIAAALGKPSVTAAGAPGATILRAFIDMTSIASRLPDMLDGSWVSSPMLSSVDGSVTTAVRMTARINSSNKLGETDGVGYYQIEVGVSVLTPAGVVVPFTVNTAIRMVGAMAERHRLSAQQDSGPQSPAPQDQQSAPRAYLPPYLSYALSVGDAKATDVDLRGLRDQIEGVLRKQLGLSTYLPRWVTGERDGQDTSDFPTMMGNQRALEGILSQLRAEPSRMLVDGASVRLKSRGLFTNDYLTVRLAAKLREDEYQATVAGKHRFSGELDYEVTVEHYSRPRAWARKLLPDRGMPAPVTVARTVRNPDGVADAGIVVLQPLSGTVKFEMADNAVFDRRMDAHQPGQAELTQLTDPQLSVDGPMQPPGVDLVTEWENIKAIVGFDQIHDAAIATLQGAEGGGETLTHRDTPSRKAIDELFTRARFDELVRTGLVEKNLRSHSRSGEVGARAKLVNPRLVDAPESGAGLVLVQVDAVVDIVAKSTDFQGRASSHGIRLTLPGAVFLTVRDEQARSMGSPPVLPRLPALPPDRVGGRRLTGPDGPSQIGTGKYEQLPDLAGMVESLRIEVNDQGLDAAFQRVRDTLSQMRDRPSGGDTKKFMDKVFDGGALLEDGSFVLQTSATEAARFSRVRNGGSTPRVAAYYTMRVKFALLAQLPGGEHKFVTSDWTEVGFLLLADDQSTPGRSGGGEARPAPVSENEDLGTWKSGSVWRPDRERVSVVSVDGVMKLRSSIWAALTSAGGRPPEGRMSAIDAQSLRTDLVEMIQRGKTLEDFSVRVHARLRAPRLVGMTHLGKIMGLVRYDVDYRIEAGTRNGPVYLTVPSSATIRLDWGVVTQAFGRPGLDLQEVKDAHEAVRNAEQIWHSAQARLTDSHNAAVKSKAVNLPLLSTRRAEAAALARQVAMAQDELKTLDQSTGDVLPQSFRDKLETLLEDLQEKVRHANLADAAVQELQAMVDAGETDVYYRTRVAKQAQEAWWRLKAELDERIVDVNRRITDDVRPISQPDATDPVSADGGTPYFHQVLEIGGVTEGVIFEKDMAWSGRRRDWFSDAKPDRERTFVTDDSFEAFERMPLSQRFAAVRTVEPPYVPWLLHGGWTFFVDVHSNGAEASMYDGNNNEIARLNGSDFADVVLRSDEFRRAASREDRPLTSFTVVACEGFSTVKPGSSLVFDFHRRLSERGYELPVHGITNVTGAARRLRKSGAKIKYRVIFSGGQWATMDQSVVERRSILDDLAKPDRVAAAKQRVDSGDASEEDQVLFATDEIVRKVIASWLPGELDLVELSTKIESGPRPEMVWGTTLAYLADQATTGFQRVTDIYRDHDGRWRKVVPPGFAGERFVVTGKGTWDEDKGTVTRPVEMVASEQFPHRTAWQTGEDLHQTSGETTEAVDYILDMAEWLVEAALERRADGLPLPIVEIRSTNNAVTFRQMLIEKMTLIMYQLDPAAAGQIQVADMVRRYEVAGGDDTSEPSGMSVIVRVPPDGQPVNFDATERNWV